MSDWQGAWFLAKHEIWKNRWGILITAVIIGYLLLFIIPAHAEVTQNESPRVAGWAMDFLFLTLLPCLGVMSSQMTRMYWKTDPFTKKLQIWRTMPISLRQISLGKLVQLVITLLSAQTIFFILYYIGIHGMDVEVEMFSFVLNAAFWFGFSLAMSVICVYLEIGYSGKVYSIVYFILMIIILIGTILFSSLVRQSIVATILKAINNGSWWIAAIAIAAGIAAILIGFRAMVRRLQRRQFVS